MTADEHLAELKRIATATLKATKIAARNEGLTIVNADRLAGLEKLAVSVAEAFNHCKMTRHYEDCITKDDTYNGKRWLFRRDDGDQMYGDVCHLVPNVFGQQGCMVKE